VNEIEEPYFLFIVPTLNSYKILENLVYSIKEQTYKRWNILFIDGNSSEKHKTWLKNLSRNDFRFKVINETGKKGIYSAMNLGCKSIKDDFWVFFLGSDDVLYDNHSLELVAEKIKAYFNKDISLLISNSNFINPINKKIIRKNKVPFKHAIKRKNLSNIFFRGYVPDHQSVCYSSTLLKNIPLYSEDYFLASDLEMFIRISRCKKLKNILFLNETFANVASGGISSKLLIKKYLEVTKIYFQYYGLFFFIPLLLRYLRKSISIIRCISKNI
tara:strand:+ start:221 stop:1036 length:816 start_codon:yes stop_codon:yes gene_type:complete